MAIAINIRGAAVGIVAGENDGAGAMLGETNSVCVARRQIGQSAAVGECSRVDSLFKAKEFGPG